MNITFTDWMILLRLRFLPVICCVFSIFLSIQLNAQAESRADRIIRYSKKVDDTNVEKARKLLFDLLGKEPLTKNELVSVYIELSALETKTGNLKQALHYALIALKEAEKNKNFNGIAAATFQIGMVYKTLNLSLKAAHYFKQSETNYKRAGEPKMAIRARTYLAHVYTDYGRDKKNHYFIHRAEKIYTAILQEAIRNENSNVEQVSYNNLANLFLVKYGIDGNPDWLDECREYSLRTMNTALLNGDSLSYTIALSNYGEAFSMENKVDSAAYHMGKANQLYLKLGAPYYYFYNAKLLARLYLKTGHLDWAKEQLVVYKRVIDKYQEYIEYKDYYTLKAALESELGNYKEAYELRLKYSEIMEQIREDESARELVRLQFLYDIDKKNQEIEILNKNEKLQRINTQNQQWIRNLLIGGLVLLVAMLIFGYLRYREKTQLNKLIIQKNKELQRLSIVASNTSNAISVSDRSGDIIWINHGFLKLYGWNSMDDLMKYNGNSIFNHCGLTRAEINQYIEEIQETRSSVVFQAFKEQKNGEQKFIQTTLTPVFDLNGLLEQLVFIDTDITELLEAREVAIREKRKAENALKTQELFLANVSHEIRTPMNGIIGLTRQLNEELSSDKHREITRAIHISAENLLHVVNDLLDVSKIRAGKMSIENTGFSLKALFDNFRQSITYRLDEKGLKFVPRMDVEIEDRVLGDPIRLNQVLLNLVGNAIKFTMSGSVFLDLRLISKDEDEELVEFEIKDTGIGIPDSKKDLVFEYFTQLEDHRTRTVSGTGLGLGISKSLVEAMGGTLLLQSEEGVGTTIRFTIPFSLNPKDDAFYGKQHDVVLHKDLSGLKILLVEDNRINQKVIVHDLEKWKCEVEVVDDAFEAIESLKTTHFDIILMDYYMPRMDGIETTQYIRTKFPEPTRSVPIIAITASAMRGDNDMFVEAGMNDYISKPFNPEKLYHLLVKWGYHGSDMPLKKAVSETPKNEENDAVDLTLILEKAEGDTEYLGEMYQAFLDMIPQYKETLEQWARENNLEELRKSAHQLLSPGKLFGMHTIIPYLSELETNKTLSKETIDDLVKKISDTLDQGCQFIRKQLINLTEE